jgi:hypothetical protein
MDVREWVARVGARVVADDTQNAWAMSASSGRLTPVLVPDLRRLRAAAWLADDDVTTPMADARDAEHLISGDLGLLCCCDDAAGPVNRTALRMLCEWLAWDWPQIDRRAGRLVNALPPRGVALLFRRDWPRYPRAQCDADWPRRFRRGVPFPSRADALRYARNDQTLRACIIDVLRERVPPGCAPTAGQLRRAHALLCAALWWRSPAQVAR